MFKHKRRLKMILNKKGDLTSLFDSIELGVEAIDDWNEFEMAMVEEAACEILYLL